MSRSDSRWHTDCVLWNYEWLSGTSHPWDASGNPLNRNRKWGALDAGVWWCCQCVWLVSWWSRGDKVFIVIFSCLTLDIWSSRQMRSYLGISAHYIQNEWEMKTIVLACKRFQERHTAVLTSCTNMRRLSSIICDKVTNIVTNNASNMIAALALPSFTEPVTKSVTTADPSENDGDDRLEADDFVSTDDLTEEIYDVLPTEHRQCFAQSLQLVVKDGLMPRSQPAVRATALACLVLRRSYVSNSASPAADWGLKVILQPPYRQRTSLAAAVPPTHRITCRKSHSAGTFNMPLPFLQRAFVVPPATCPYGGVRVCTAVARHRCVEGTTHARRTHGHIFFFSIISMISCSNMLTQAAHLYYHGHVTVIIMIGCSFWYISECDKKRLALFYCLGYGLSDSAEK